jgi:phosphinothricin acetyltransferase
MEIRPVRPVDLAQIQVIYAHHVSTGYASFEEDPPDLAEMEKRCAALLARGFPYLVASEPDGTILGYAYAGPFRPRRAYRFSVENSIYMRPDAAGRGVGRALLTALIEAAAAWGARQMIAVIGDSANAASIGLHKALGFQPAGVIRSVGFKHGRWLDSVLMQLPLGDGDASPPHQEVPL